jgi:hypothetical protein
MDEIIMQKFACCHPDQEIGGNRPEGQSPPQSLRRPHSGSMVPETRKCDCDAGDVECGSLLPLSRPGACPRPRVVPTGWLRAKRQQAAALHRSPRGSALQGKFLESGAAKPQRIVFSTVVAQARPLQGLAVAARPRCASAALRRQRPREAARWAPCPVSRATPDEEPGRKSLTCDMRSIYDVTFVAQKGAKDT